MTEIKIEVERTFLEKIKNPMQRVLDRAIVRSLNRTVSSVRTLVAREIVDKTGMKKKDIMPRLFINKAERSNADASLVSLGNGLPLALFGAKRIRVSSNRGKRYGVTALVRGTRQVIPGAFLATMKSGKTGVWERVGSDRLPIRQLFSSDVQDFIRSDTGFLSRVKTFAKESFDKNFASDYEFYAEREKLRTK